MSQEHRRRSARRGSVWRTITAIAGAAAMVTAMAALAPAANAGGGGNGVGDPTTECTNNISGFTGYGIKLDTGDSGTYTYSTGSWEPKNLSNTLTVIIQSNKRTFSLTGNPIPDYVLIKASTGHQVVTDPTQSTEYTSAIKNNGENYAAISHLTFCFSNDQTPEPTTGSFVIEKTVTGEGFIGDDGATKMEFSGTYTCTQQGVTDPVNTGNFAITTSDSKTVSEVPIGAVCSVVEITPTGGLSTGYSWNSPTYDPASVTIAAGSAQKITVQNTTSADSTPEPTKPTVTVNKVWKINGGMATKAQAIARGLKATPTIKADRGAVEDKEWGVAYPYDENTKLTINENEINTGKCVGGLITPKWDRSFKITENTTVTLTNAYICPPQITITKQWMIDGENASFDEAEDLGLTATPNISVKVPILGYVPVDGIVWDTAYSSWFNVLQPTLRINENVTNESDGACTVDPERSTSLPKTVTLKADTTINIVNAYDCKTTPEVPMVQVNLYKEWTNATGSPKTALTITSGDSTSNPASTTWNETLGTDPDFGSGHFASLDVSALPDTTVTITEGAISGYPASWSATWACYPNLPELRSSAAGAFASVAEAEPVFHGTGTSGTFTPSSDYPYLDCFFTNTRNDNPTTTTFQPTSVTPSYGAQCTVGDSGDHIMVTTPEVINGIRYVVVGEGTDSVTITASPADTAHTVTVPAGSPWSAMTDGTATITVNSTSPEELTCVASEQQEEPPAEQGESATKPKPKPKPEITVEVKGESQEVISGAPSATAKTGESGSAYWTYLTLAAGVLLLLGSARIRRRDDGA